MAAAAETVPDPVQVRALSGADDGLEVGELTVLTPPHPTAFMQHRPRLALDPDRSTVTEVWAAAGAGKTTLLTLWAAELQSTETVAWLGLSGAGSRRAPLPNLVGAALRLADRPGMDVPSGPVTEHELTVRRHPVTLFIDDVHLLIGRSEGDWLTAFIARRPEQLRIVLAGRYAPASLVRVGLLPEVRELRSAALAFDRTETEAFFRSRSLELAPALIDQAFTKTEGWAAALSLFAGWFRNMPDMTGLPPDFLEDHRAVGDYLVNEVLDRLPEERRRFLLLTSVVDRLTVPLAIHLSGNADAGDILDSLEWQTALLSHTSRGERHYTYHATLHTYLRAELRRRDFSAMQRAQAAAAEWYRMAGRPDLALDLALTADATSDLLRLVEEDGVELVFGGHGALVQRALEQVPTSDAERPMVNLLALLVSAPYLPDDAIVDVHLAAVAAGITGLTPRQRMLHCTLRLLHECGPSREADGIRRAASLAELDASVQTALDDIAAGGTDLTVDAARFAMIARAHVLRMAGDPDAALRTLRLAAAQARTSTRVWLQLVLLDATATAAAAEGNWAEALDAQDRMTELIPPDRVYGDVVSARVQFAVTAAAFSRCTEPPPHRLDELLSSAAARLDPGVAVPAQLLQLLIELDESPGHRERFEALDRLLMSRGHAHRRSLAACSYRYVALALQLHDRHRAVEARDLIATTLGADSLEATLASALVAAANGRHAHAEELLLAGVEGRSRTWNSGTPVLAWITLALWADRSGRDAAADARLLRALEGAEGLELRRPFIALGGLGIRLLHSRLGRLGTLDPFAQSIVEVHRRSTAGDAAATDDLIVFTPKEREILRELPKHQSVSEIAGHQHLSPNTVKTHLRSIYQKLGVSGRAQAVEQATAHGLL